MPIAMVENAMKEHHKGKTLSFLSVSSKAHECFCSANLRILTLIVSFCAVVFKIRSLLFMLFSIFGVAQQ
jgi:hypothetical protein